MNAMTGKLTPAACVALDVLEQRRRRLLEAQRHQLASENITVLWTPAAASAEERMTIATLLLAGTGLRVTRDA